MITGNINYETSNFLPQAILKSLEHLKQLDFSTLENKRYEIDGEKRFLVIHNYQTLPRSERKAEVHREYIDVQFVISGQEKIYFGFSSQDSSLIEDKLDSDDYALYRDIPHEKEISLFPGDYAVFFPGELHRPGCDLERKCDVRKAIIKIAIDELK